MSRKTDWLIDQLNNIVAQGSERFGLDLMTTLDATLDLPKIEFSNDDRLNRQFQACALIVNFLTWATLHPEDFQAVAQWWNENVAPEIGDILEEIKNNR